MARGPSRKTLQGIADDVHDVNVFVSQKREQTEGYARRVETRLGKAIASAQKAGNTSLVAQLSLLDERFRDAMGHFATVEYFLDDVEQGFEDLFAGHPVDSSWGCWR